MNSGPSVSRRPGWPTPHVNRASWWPYEHLFSGLNAEGISIQINYMQKAIIFGAPTKVDMLLDEPS